MPITLARRLRFGTTLAVASAASLVLFASGAEPPAPVPQAPEPVAQVQPLNSPARAGSMAPSLSVSGNRVLMSWIERSGSNAALRFAELGANGWSTARTAASGDNWFVNWADVPSVRRLSNGTLVAHWLQKSAASTYAYGVRLAYSTDGVKWSEPFSPHHDDTPTEHGFVSMFETASGGLGLVWLDGREMAPMPGMEHGAGDMTLRYAAYDARWKQVADERIDARVCECCPTSIAVTADGPLVAFRNRGDDETRDIFVSRLNGGAWSAPAAAHADGWRIDACPVNGPALDAAGTDVALAWFTGAGNENHAYAAFSSDAGRSFGTPVRLDDNRTLGRVGIARLGDGSAIAMWMEPVTGGAELRVRRVTKEGQRSAAKVVTPMSAARSSGYPRIVRQGARLVFAWTSVAADGTTQVQTAAAAVR